MLFLTTHSIWYAAILLLAPATLIAMAGPLVIRRFVTLDRLRNNNEVAGFKFATVGVIYAVLLAFAVIVVWERFNQAESGVAKEATAAVTILRLAQGIDPEHGARRPQSHARLPDDNDRARLAGHGTRPAEHGLDRSARQDLCRRSQIPRFWR
jgi:hypothetical protein